MSVNLGQHGAVAMSHQLGDGQVVVALDKLTRREAMTRNVHGLTEALDSALARLELAARACHARLGLAMGTLRQTVSEISETMEALTAGIFEDLSTEAHVRGGGIDPDTSSEASAMNAMSSEASAMNAMNAMTAMTALSAMTTAAPIDPTPANDPAADGQQTAQEADPSATSARQAFLWRLRAHLDDGREKRGG